MRGLARLSGLVALIAAFFVLPVGVPAAFADTTDIIEEQHTPSNDEDGFQAGTCFSDEPVKCSPETPELWYQQAAGHPPIGFTQYIIRHAPFTPLPSPPFPPGSVTAPLQEPILGRSIKTLQIDIPPGLIVNPEATPRCPRADFERVLVIGGEPRRIPNCPDGSIVGQEEVTLVTNAAGVEGLPKGFVIPPDPAKGTKVPLYNIVPEFGEPARFGFIIGFGRVVFLETRIAWESDYHGSFTIRPPQPTIPGVSTLKSRLVNYGRDAGNKKLAAPGSNVVIDDPTDPNGDGTYLTMPTTCFDPDTGAYSTFFRAESWEEPNPTFPEGSTAVEAALPEGVAVVGCDLVPFDPSLEVSPGTDQIDSPAAPVVTVKMPFEPNPVGLERSHVRNADLVLPEGMGLNPSAAPGLETCTTEQFGKGTRNPVACPAGSKIGTAEVETQPLPPDSLNGDVYLGQQLSRDPESGEMYRIFINPKSDRYGVDVRLIGNIKADAETGQLTASLRETPQVPFESVTMRLDPDKGLVTSPPTCGPNQSTGSLEPWARPGTFATPTSEFKLTSSPKGGGCPETLAARPFEPGFGAGPRNGKAGAFSPFELRIFRDDGEQEIRRVDVHLPPGMVAKLRGVEYCPEDAIAGSGAKSGSEVLASPLCPESSWVGTAKIHAGSGPNPLKVDGNVYLAGPYKEAPVSLVFVTSAVAGPFDLGTVVVRVALNVDRETAEVHAVSDPIPFVFGGAKLGIRKIEVELTRKKFTLNPTTCRSGFQVLAGIFGGGANPLDPASWFEAKPSSPFRATECRKLKFKPKFAAKILGGKGQTQRADNPKFRAIFDARKNDANLRRVAFILPRATILDQGHIRTICTRVQLAARECPKKAIYGHARASSPLVKGDLKGPVYLTSSDNPLPDLLVDLRGQVDIQLRGVISSVKNGRLKTVFPKVPDVAVNRFVLTMRGGNRGLLVNSQNLCARKRTGFLNMKAQNSRRTKKNLRLQIQGCREG